jgi:uncharacterized repeat protein (TIGR01451 family)
VPTTTATVPPNPFLGTDVNLSATFTNTGDAPGFGPFIDVILPTPGADGPPAMEGLSYNSGSATHLGHPVTAFVTTFDANGHAAHPLAVGTDGKPIIVNGPPGDQLVVFQLHFGSFTPGQPTAKVNFTAHLSNMADVGEPITISTGGGFWLGADPLNNPATDPSIIGPQTTTTTTPSVIRVTKKYLGPEQETATGPNFPKQYLVQVAVAPGQTIDNFDLIDNLPSNMQFVSVDSVSGNGSTTTTPVSVPSTTTPGGTIDYSFDKIVGTGNPTDAQLRFTFYIPENDASGAPVLNLNTGAFATSTDNAVGQGTFVPLNPTDPDTPVSVSAQDTITGKSIAIQKGMTDLTNPSAPKSGDTLQYTLNFQVSDFFALQQVLARDVFSDGQTFDTSFTPTITFTQHGQTVSGAFNPTTYTFTRDTGHPGATGQTTVDFNVSAELAALGLSSGGTLLGGSIPAGGTGGPPPDPTPAFGGTTGTIIFRTKILNNYTDQPSPGAPVVQGDHLTDTATVGGGIASFANLMPTGNTQSDATSAAINIPRGLLSKKIYAINGNTNFGSAQVAPGDTVTYELMYTLPASSIVDYSISDFLPLPIFPMPSSVTFNPTVSATPPPVGQAQFGPSDTFFGISGIKPTVTTNATANSVTFNFGSFKDPQNRPSTTDILFTVQASDQPFSDRLFLTDHAHQSEGSSTGGSSTQNAIQQIQVLQPNVVISKGVVSTNDPGATFSPGTVGPVGVTFAPPGQTGSAFTGTITSAGLQADPIMSNLSGIQAGDLVKFAIVVQNVGSAPDGSFNVDVKDTLPAGFQIPTGATGLNLQVVDGTGAAFVVNDSGGGLFGNGIQLVDPGPTPTPPGALDPGKTASGDTINNGRNIAIITYDLQATQAVTPNQKLTNTATLTNYANTPNGPNFVPDGLTDTSTVTVASPSPPPPPETADVSLTKQVSQTNPIFGTPVTYTLIVHNNGPAAATGVVATDALPAGVIVITATPSQGSFDAGSGRWTIGTLPNGATVTLQITDLVAAIGPITNTSSVAALQFDPNLANNVSSVTIDGMLSAGQVSKRLFLSSGDPSNAAMVAGEEALFNALMPLWMNLWDAMLSEVQSLLAARDDPGPGNGGVPLLEGNWFGSPWVVYANPFGVTAVQVGTFDFLYQDDSVVGVRLL